MASGANHALTPTDVDRAADAIRAADVVMLQLEIPMDVVEHAAATGRRGGRARDPQPGPGRAAGHGTARATSPI